MHKIFFGLKRAYHGTLRVTRRGLARLGLTPARFDLLYIVDQAGGEMPQRELQKALGVASSTVSRMITSLEELGLILRDVMLQDFRRSWLELTEAGRRMVRKAARQLIHTGHIQLAVDSALCPHRWHEKKECRSASFACERALDRFRHAYGDIATADYPRSPKFELLDVKSLWQSLLARTKL